MKTLAERMRPSRFEGYVGQEHLLGENGPIQKMLAAGQLSSMILWGPPGCGKTTLVEIIAKQLDRKFISMSAVEVGVKQVRELVDSARKSDLFASKPPILFLDEIHRFNKAQQDSLLGPMEKNEIILIGATTENPSFSLNNALLSRLKVYTLLPLAPERLLDLLRKAIDKDFVLKQRQIHLEETDALIAYSGGDARVLLNLFESTVLFADEPVKITNRLVREVAQERMPVYDRAGDSHYQIVSAFIKSIRGSDPDAGIYWLARMLHAGEDPIFIARRLLILASEDIGNANPMALMVANQTFQAVKEIGMPEARIILAQAVTYLASSEKSNASYLAITEALEFVKKTGDKPVPLHLRNASNSFLKEEGYGDGYRYPHDFPGGFISQKYFPDDLEHETFYYPKNIGMEEKISHRLRELRAAFKRG